MPEFEFKPYDSRWYFSGPVRRNTFDKTIKSVKVTFSESGNNVGTDILDEYVQRLRGRSVEDDLKLAGLWRDSWAWKKGDGSYTYSPHGPAFNATYKNDTNKADIIAYGSGQIYKQQTTFANHKDFSVFDDDAKQKEVPGPKDESRGAFFRPRQARQCARDDNPSRRCDVARKREGARSKSKARTASQNAPRGMAGNMAELIERFGTEEACELHMIGLRWPGGFGCPRCGHRECARVSGRREFRCAGCGWQFSATGGTAIAHTKVPLTKWFRAAFMVCSDARGTSAQAVARECGVSDLTGQTMLRRPRSAMGVAMSTCEVGGEWVELDRASVSCGDSGGGVRHAGSGKTDAPVPLAVSGTRMAARSASDVTAGSVSEFCARHVSRHRPVRCDDHPSHRQALPGGWDAVVRESEADGDTEASPPAVHHAISNLKAKLEGTCHGVTVGRLQEHLDEFAWKYSHRLGDQMADLLGELARWPHVRLADIRGVCATQPPHASALDPGYRHNRYVDRKMLGRIRGWLVGELVAVAEAKAAGAAALTHL